MGCGAADEGEVGGRLAAPYLLAGEGGAEGLFSSMVVVIIGVGTKASVSGCGVGVLINAAEFGAEV